jgi:integrase
MTWERFRELYETEELPSKRPETQDKVHTVFDSLERLAKPKRLCDLNERLLSRYAAALRENGLQASTVKGYLAYLASALSWAKDQKLVAEMPTIRMPKVPKKRRADIRTVTAEEFERLIEKAPSAQWAALIATAWYAGLRRGELFDLTWNDQAAPHIDFARNRINLPAEYTKAVEDQWVPLHPQLAQILQALPRAGRRIFSIVKHKDTITGRFEKIAKQAGLKLTPHDLRRSFGSRYASVVQAPVLQRLMRHANIATTMEFYTNVESVLQDAIGRA